MKLPRMTTRKWMMAVVAVAVLLVIAPPVWRAVRGPGRHRHKVIAIHKGSYTFPSGLVVHGGVISVFDDGCVFAD
jgi:hypothetical protein